MYSHFKFFIIVIIIVIVMIPSSIFSQGCWNNNVTNENKYDDGIISDYLFLELKCLFEDLIGAGLKKNDTVCILIFNKTGLMNWHYRNVLRKINSYYRKLNVIPGKFIIERYKTAFNIKNKKKLRYNLTKYGHSIGIKKILIIWLDFKSSYINMNVTGFNVRLKKFFYLKHRQKFIPAMRQYYISYDNNFYYTNLYNQDYNNQIKKIKLFIPEYNIKFGMKYYFNTYIDLSTEFGFGYNYISNKILKQYYYYNENTQQYELLPSNEKKYLTLNINNFELLAGINIKLHNLIHIIHIPPSYIRPGLKWVLKETIHRKFNSIGFSLDIETMIYRNLSIRAGMYFPRKYPVEWYDYTYYYDNQTTKIGLDLARNITFSFGLNYEFGHFCGNCVSGQSGCLPSSLDFEKTSMLCGGATLIYLILVIIASN